jgi:hypothetical protein
LSRRRLCAWAWTKRASCRSRSDLPPPHPLG